MTENKKQKQILKSTQYKLEIIFNTKLVIKTKRTLLPGTYH